MLIVLKVLGSSVLTEPANNGRNHPGMIINKLLPSMTQILKTKTDILRQFHNYSL